MPHLLLGQQLTAPRRCKFSEHATPNGGRGTLSVTIPTLQKVAREACIYAFNAETAKEYPQRVHAYKSDASKATDVSALDYCHVQGSYLIIGTDCDYMLNKDINLDQKKTLLLLRMVVDSRIPVGLHLFIICFLRKRLAITGIHDG